MAISGSVKMLADTTRRLSGRDGVPERVRHRDAALHGRHRRQGQDAGAVARGVDAAHRRARDAVDGDVARLRPARPRSPRARSRGSAAPSRRRAGRASRSTSRPSSSRTTHPVGGALDRGHARAPEHLHAALGEDVLDDLGGVGVLTGQHAVARGDEDDLRAQAEVGLGELGAGDARPDDDEPLGQGVEVVDLLPGEDALAVGAGGVRDPRGGAGRDEHDVGLELLGARPTSRRAPRSGTSAGPCRRARAPRPPRGGWQMSALCAAASASTRRLTSPSSATASETSSPSASSRWTPRSAAVSNSLM